MIQQLIYEDSKLPGYLKYQAFSFLRIQYPVSFLGKNKLRNWITQSPYHPLHFVLVESDLLISYVGVVWKNLMHAGKIYKTYGLSGVFTFPSFRKQGYGLKLIKKAKEYLDKSDGDIVIFTSIHLGFYEKAGFIHLKEAKILQGNPKHPEEVKENVFMLFLSKKGKDGKKDFETLPIYFGKNTW